MSRKYYNSIDNLSIPTLYVGSAAPIDSKSVVTNLTDLTDSKLLSTTYVGMVVYVEEDSNLYVCVAKGRNIKTLEQGWKRITDNVSMIFDTKKSLTDGSILFPFQGMIVYINEEWTLYVLTSKGIENSKVEENWKPIGGGNFNINEYLNFNAKPTSGSGFKIEDGTTIISSYINNTHEFEKGVFYTSQGMNSYGDVPEYVVNYNYID